MNLSGPAITMNLSCAGVVFISAVEGHVAIDCHDSSPMWGANWWQLSAFLTEKGQALPNLLYLPAGWTLHQLLEGPEVKTSPFQ